MLGRDDLLVVDCRFDLGDPQRGQREYALAHIPGAVYADLDRDLCDLWKADLGRHPLPDAEAFSEVLGRWGWTPRTQVVAYDAAGGANAAARLWWMLRVIGHGNVAVLDGGLQAWNSVAWPLSSDTVRRPCTAVEARFDRRKLYTRIPCRRFSRMSCCSMLVRHRATAARSSRSIRWLATCQAHAIARFPKTSGRRKVQGGYALRAREFSKLIAPNYPRDVVHMCGSGVTACHNLLAMEHAGLAGSRLYAPSWSGWIADPTRPVERSVG
jgi:thiosulfate/3-mercaptopyruvate sulfurtransferase